MRGEASEDEDGDLADGQAGVLEVLGDRGEEGLDEGEGVASWLMVGAGPVGEGGEGEHGQGAGLGVGTGGGDDDGGYRGAEGEEVGGGKEVGELEEGVGYGGAVAVGLGSDEAVR